MPRAKYRTPSATIGRYATRENTVTINNVMVNLRSLSNLRLLPRRTFTKIAVYEAQITSNRRHKYGSQEYRAPCVDRSTKSERMYITELRADNIHTTRMNSKHCNLEVARCRHGNRVAYSLSRDMAAKFEIEARLVKMSSPEKLDMINS